MKTDKTVAVSRMKKGIKDTKDPPSLRAIYVMHSLITSYMWKFIGVGVGGGGGGERGWRALGMGEEAIWVCVKIIDYRSNIGTLITFSRILSIYFVSHMLACTH